MPVSIAEIEADTGMQNLYNPGGGPKPHDCFLAERYGVAVDVTYVPAKDPDPDVVKYYNQVAKNWQHQLDSAQQKNFVGTPPSTQSVLSVEDHSEDTYKSLPGAVLLFKQTSYCSIMIQTDDTSENGRSQVKSAVMKLAQRIEPRMA